MTPAQISFCREVVSQNLGNPPSKFWGSNKIKIVLPQSKDSLQYFLEATEHPKHIMSEKLSKHKEGGSVVGAIGEAIMDGGKAVGRVVASGAKWAAAHASQIATGLGTALQLGATGVQLAASVGLLDPDSDATLIGLANATQQVADTYHAEKAEKAEKAAASKKSETKKGEGWDDVKKWASDTGTRIHDWVDRKQHPENQPQKIDIQTLINRNKPVKATAKVKMTKSGGKLRRARIHRRR